MRHCIVFMIMLCLGISACANTPASDNDQNVTYYPVDRPYLPVETKVISDNSGALPEYPVNSDTLHYRAYLQATNNDRYRIRVSNNTGQRIGIVIAVDGRNIISGQKSYLQNTERMYILNPHSSSEYEGWRTGINQTNRFYFTEAGNSYAAAWGDNSAMGVIAMAVYPERPRYEILTPMPDRDRMAPSGAESAAKQAIPGTGFGETTHSPSIAVNFEPLPEPIEKVFLKYEWRETLCKRRIMSACQTIPNGEENRFWPDNDASCLDM